MHDIFEAGSPARALLFVVCPIVGLLITLIFLNKSVLSVLAGVSKLQAAVLLCGAFLLACLLAILKERNFRAFRLCFWALAIGQVIEVHYYDGNRGPLWHTADKIETAPTPERKAASWFYSQAKGGGSLLDYLGYGTTLGAWYHGGRAPNEVTAVVDRPAGREVDEHSVTIARYASGLSKFETRWGAFTDPWTIQPQPKCGFVIVGTEGTISSYDYEPTIRVQTRAHPAGETLPVDTLLPPYQNPVQYLIHCISTGEPISGPLAPEISRIGQQIVDSAVLSAREQRTVALLG
jgi:glucose-fructose oxidoreductase